MGGRGGRVGTPVVEALLVSEDADVSVTLCICGNIEQLSCGRGAHSGEPQRCLANHLEA